MDAGGVDGCTKQRTLSVDHLDLATHLSVLRAVSELTKKTLDEMKTEPCLFIPDDRRKERHLMLNYR